MTASPTNADSGQRALFRAYLGSRPAVYVAALGSAGAFVYGASQQDVLIMAGGPAAVVALVVLTAVLVADRSAANRFYLHYARSLGLVYWPRASLPPLTPLLGAGDRRWCEHWMQGSLPGDPALAGGIGHLVWEERRERPRDEAAVTLGSVASRHRLTICAVDLESSIKAFHGVFLRPRRGVISSVPDWLGQTGTRSMAVESAAFSKRYDLLISLDQDELLARQLLSPSLVVWLAEHPLAPAFELRAGMLVTYVAQSLGDEGSLTFLMDAARKIAGRVLDETGEAADRPAAKPLPPAATGAGAPGRAFWAYRG
ncbi:MAG TPA: hypothetical protein VFQ12_09070 [Thermoleophilaceae bacterium]|nr:hypothetical protein [Thermoleophilaceae bacterium]